MLPKINRFGYSNSKWCAAVRFGLVSLFFLAGIICTLGTGKMMATQTDPTRANDQDIEIVKEDIKDLKEDIADLEQSVQNNPNSKLLENELARKKNLLKENEEWLEKAQNSRDTGTCFTADVRVLTMEGAKPISEINVGDKVLSVDADGNQVASDVLKTIADRNRHYYLINGSIKATGMHRFFTDAGWKRVKELRVGNKIKTTSGSFEEVVSVEWVPKDGLDVYSLTIAENHNFYVSTDGKKGFLVHNHGDGGGK